VRDKVHIEILRRPTIWPRPLTGPEKKIKKKEAKWLPIEDQKAK